MPRIARLDTFHNEFVCFVKATAEDGVVGWGQTSTYNADITAQAFHRQIAPWALGRPCADIGALVDRIERAEHKYPGSYRNRALAGLDTALWDMAGEGARAAAVGGGGRGGRAGRDVGEALGEAPDVAVGVRELWVHETGDVRPGEGADRNRGEARDRRRNAADADDGPRLEPAAGDRDRRPAE